MNLKEIHQKVVYKLELCTKNNSKTRRFMHFVAGRMNQFGVISISVVINEKINKHEVQCYNR